MKYAKLDEQVQKRRNIIVDSALSGSHENGWINISRRERVWYEEDGITVSKREKLTPDELKYFGILGDV